MLRNVLIIQHSIERLVLVDKDAQAMQLVREQTGRQARNAVHDMQTFASLSPEPKHQCFCNCAYGFSAAVS